MSFMLKRVYQGLLYKTESLHIHPLVGIVIIFIQFGFLIPNINWLLLLLLIFILVENILLKNVKGALSILWFLFPLIVIVGGLTFIFGGWVQVFRVISRFLIGGLGFSLFFALVNPSDLTRSFENLHISSKIAIIPSLALMMIPRMAKDAEDTFNTLLLRGEIKGFIFSWLPKTLALMIASILYRSDFLAQSLYFKGFGIQKRTHYKKVEFSKVDLFRILFWLIFIMLFILFLKFDVFSVFSCSSIC
ncbi:MAG: hypothetical protein ACTSX6_09295 [Candidatus Heimdallarchaeaceae archaeon]